VEEKNRTPVVHKVAIAYGIMAVGCLLLLNKLSAPLSYYKVQTPRQILTGLDAAQGLLWGAGVGLAGALVGELITRRSHWGIALTRLLRRVLGHLHTVDILLLALLSSLGEELLFRGLLMPYAGLVGSSALFGLAHLLPRRSLWLWSVWATAMGFAFGLLASRTGGILAPAAAHFAINAIGLASLSRRKSS